MPQAVDARCFVVAGFGKGLLERLLDGRRRAVPTNQPLPVVPWTQNSGRKYILPGERLCGTSILSIERVGHWRIARTAERVCLMLFRYRYQMLG